DVPDVVQDHRIAGHMERGEGLEAACHRCVLAARPWPRNAGAAVGRALDRGSMEDLALDSPALLEGLCEAAMILSGDRVIAANAAARSLLGDGIRGSALHQVISHPAALAALERGVEAAEGVELTGLGGSGRNWLM